MTKTDTDDTQIVSRLLTVLYYVNRMGQVCAMEIGAGSFWAAWHFRAIYCLLWRTLKTGENASVSSYQRLQTASRRDSGRTRVDLS
jgi:hypothetical protein